MASSTSSSDLEPGLAQRPRCPHCQTQMISSGVSEGPEGFEHRKFECLKCGHTEINIVPSDPLEPNSTGWKEGQPDDKPGAVTHKIETGRMVPKKG